MVADLAALVDHRVDALEGGGDLGGESLVGRLEGRDIVLQGEHVRLRVVGFVAQGGDLDRIHFGLTREGRKRSYRKFI